ncbi:Hsp20/alpha crystallin family protein [Pseudoflavitalea sp. G-6-1-2]|uniref:Hsp20/alpha crystallin family protein n=1 Tax=Pseudoflavitalea sp. G-6-1-2 TaxID=2728841 RepID=UPI00146E420D|nr:Hsp20/alpha crystallin family protein [Pseudoflavitalea sp. G-6-1-2]NML21475.1 Hsp20/alpha crystallin family protein [Pseudoflavitalea sp. G-6-1-2]
MTFVKLNNRPVAKSVFDELFDHIPNTWKDGFHYPPVNVFESTNAFDIELSAAGLAKEDFQLNLENGLLTIAFEKKEAQKSEDQKVIRKEFSQRSFKRSFNLDEQVDAENISAKYENGVLKLHLPKKETVKPSTKQINIQ